MFILFLLLITSAKSWNARGAPHQPTFLSSCQTISHTCLPCLLGRRTLLFWSNLFVFWRVVSRERWKSSQMGRWERCMSVVRWQGGKGGRIVRKQGRRGGRVVRWQVGKGGRVVRWQDGKGGRVMRWHGEGS